MTENSENTKQSNSTKPVLANRLFKFRAWVKEQNRMIKVFGFNEHLVFEQTWDSPSIKENIFEIEDCHIMQFTGFFDKNGTKLFEGDIIKRVVKSSKLLPAKIYFEVIRFEDASFKTFDLKKENDMGDVLADYSFHKIEKVGNIFQNPEFLQTTS